MRSRAVTGSLLLALSLVAGAAPARAAGDAWFEGEPFSATPETLLAAAEATQLPADAEVVILTQRWSRQWDDEGRVTATLYQVYQVRSKAALDGWGLSEARWSPWYQARPEIRARVVSPDGAEHWLDPASLSDSGVGATDPTMFDDDQLLRGPLPGMVIGAVIEEQIVQRDEKPFFPGGGSTRLPLGEFVPVEHLRVVLEAPARTPLQWTVVGAEPEVRRSRGGGLQRVVIALDELAALEALEELVPADQSAYPYVEATTARSWREVATRYHEMIAPALDGEALEPLIAEVRAGESREESIRIAYTIARDRVRYTGVELGRQSIVPYSVDQTLQRRYGDCKDKASLLLALLRAAGVDAELALLRAGPGPDVEPSLPGVQLFTHAVVRVPGNPDTWLDPTAEFLSAGALPLGDQGRWAMIAAPATHELVRIPSAPSGATVYRETREIVVPVEGTADVTELTAASGWIADSLRRSYTDADEASLGSFLADYADRAYGGGALTDWSLGDLRDVARPLTIDLRVEGGRVGYASGADAVVLVDPTVILGWLPDLLFATGDVGGGALAARRHPVAPPPHRAEVVYRIAMADGYQPRELPPTRERSFGGASLVEQYGQLDDGAVQVRFALDTGTEPLAPADAQRLRDALVLLQQGSPQTLMFDQLGEVHLAHGRIRDAIQTYDDLVTRHPGVGLYRSLKGAAMLPAGLGDAARAEARRAVELDPESASAWRYLGYVLMHDRFGRELAAPFDRDGAIEALEHAIALEPMDAVAMQNLAVVLEHDRDGVRYTDTADLERAASIYRDRRERFDTRDLDLNLLFVLYHLGRHDEVQSLAAELPTGPARDSLRFASLALASGPERALAEATREALTGQPKHAELQEASRLLIQGRHYPEAAALLRGAAAGAVNPVELRQRAETLDGLHPYPEVLAAAEGPEAVVLRMMEQIFHEQTSAVDLGETMSERLLAEDSSTEELEQVLGELRGSLRRQGLSGEVVLDMALSSLEFDIDGDDRVGYRVAGRGPYDTRLANTYVVRERGEYRVLATGVTGPLLGSEALRRVGKGDVEGARRWLSWAQEESGVADDDGPFSGDPFLRLFGDGEALDRHGLRLAAAALMAPAYGARAIDELEPAVARCEDDAERVQLNRALVTAYRAAERNEDALTLAGELEQAYPAESVPALIEIRALLSLDRVDEALAAAAAMSDARPDDLAAALAAMTAARRAGDVERTVAFARRALAGAPEDSELLNEIAWYLLFVDGGAEEALQLAVRANTGGAELQQEALHTLAVAQVELGRVDEAHEVLVLALDQIGSADNLHDVWWYVLGRIAEEYGLPETARDAYGRVPADEGPMSTSVLARARLDALDGAD